MDIMSNFVKETMARLQGDSDKVIATRNERKANAAIKSQLSALESAIVDAETEVEDSKEKLTAARYPTDEIKGAGSSKAYLEGIATAKFKLEKAESKLSDLRDEMEEWSQELGVLFSKKK